MNQTVVRELLERIEALPEDDRRALERLLADRFEQEWQQVTAEAAAEADRRGITLNDIDRAIEEQRYRR